MAHYNSFTTVFSGCPYGPDDAWAIIWPNTPGGSISSQPCPGGVDAVGMLIRIPHVKLICRELCSAMKVEWLHSFGIINMYQGFFVACILNWYVCVSPHIDNVQELLLVCVMRMEYGENPMSSLANLSTYSVFHKRYAKKCMHQWYSFMNFLC